MLFQKSLDHCPALHPFDFNQAACDFCKWILLADILHHASLCNKFELIVTVPFVAVLFYLYDNFIDVLTSMEFVPIRPIYRSLFCPISQVSFVDYYSGIVHMGPKFFQGLFTKWILAYDVSGPSLSPFCAFWMIQLQSHVIDG